jgi:hypothetical protein
MTKKLLYTLIVLPVVAILAACAGLPIPGLGAAQAQAQPSQAARRNGQNGFNVDPAKMPVEQKLGIGILKLEGTSYAVTAKQAQDLLPLWKALKTLAANNNTSPDEITALYKQMEGVLTADQVKQIQNLTWTQTDMRALMQQYGIQFGGGFGGGATLDPSARATRAAQFQNGGGGGGFGGGGGGFGPGGGGGGQGGQGGANVQRTPVPGQQARRAVGGMNLIFVDPVIKLLQTKAGA